MKKVIFFGLWAIVQLSYAQEKRIFRNRNEAIHELAHKLTSGLYSGQTMGHQKCQTTLSLYSFNDQLVASFLVESKAPEHPSKIAITLTDDKNIVHPTSEIVSSEWFMLNTNTEKFRFSLLSGGNTEKYFSIEISPEGISVLAREGYILDPETPRVLCLNMKKK